MNTYFLIFIAIFLCGTSCSNATQKAETKNEEIEMEIDCSLQNALAIAKKYTLEFITAYANDIYKITSGKILSHAYCLLLQDQLPIQVCLKNKESLDENECNALENALGKIRKCMGVCRRQMDKTKSRRRMN